jgi:2-succinyl-5-enolpyruvyl-6-hydroxy-3-cyclohexene-1-carboxylate synthase
VTAATDTYLLQRAFVDELVRSGMRAACTSPGSRSAPLVLTLARESRLRCYSHVDERCAGFFALGLAKATGLPVAVACTSGTAAAELLPAAIEAHEARVPLLLLTADRPPELRETGAGQAIDQLKLFGHAAKWFFEVGTHEASRERLLWIRTLACRAYATALEGRPGVVHLNFPLREPLVTDEPLPHDSTARPDGAPYVRRAPLAAGRLPGANAAGGADEADVADADGGTDAAGDGSLRAIVSAARRGVVVAGRDERHVGSWRESLGDSGQSLGEAAAAFASAVGWPLLADPRSGARRGAAAVAHYDVLLRDETFTAALDPDLVLRVGDLPVSKPLRAWLAGLHGTRQVALDAEGAWQDPASVLSDSFALEPAAALVGMAAAAAPADESWLARWRSGDELAAEAILGVLAEDGLSEPAVAAELGVLLPEAATLFVASSMPVRDIETFWPIRADPPRVLCNRGANGIDGIVSSAFGAAAAADCPVDGIDPLGGAGTVDGINPVDGVNPVGGAGPVVLLIGDVALAHDLGGLLAARRLGLKLTIVLLDNEGGGIFDFLPVADAAVAREPEPFAQLADDIYTRHIATPTGLDFSAAASLYCLSHERVEDVPGFRAALERSLARENSSIVEVRGTREANVDLHRRVWKAVSAALTS